MPVPARPTAYLVLIQATLALGDFKTFLHRPALAGHGYHLLQGSVSGSKHPIVDPLVRQLELAAHQQPVAPAGVIEVNPPPRPVIAAWALAARSRTAPLPSLLGQPICPGVCGIRAQRVVAGDAQYVGHVTAFQKVAEVAIAAVDRVARHPAGGNTHVESALEHLARQHGLGRKSYRVRNTR